MLPSPKSRFRPSQQVLLLVGALAACGLACATAKSNPNAKAVQYQAEGARAYARGELDRAAGLFSLALEYDPRMAEARSGLGLVAFARGDKASAERQFLEALKLNEDLAEAHHNLGLLQFDRGDFNESISSFRAALAIDPGFGKARLGVGETLVHLDKLEEARWELAKLCEIEPQNPLAHAAHARVLARLDRVAAAEESVQKALALDANLVSGRRARAEILAKRGDILGALQEIRTVVVAEPASIDHRVQLVSMLIAAGIADEADRELAGLEQAAPRRAEVAYLRAMVSFKRQQYAEAINAARRALRLRRPYPWARLVLAESLFMAGKHDEGRRETQMFLEEAPASMVQERLAAQRFLNR
jgi:tetratricopeptide (TPR) repeat protein